MSDASRRRNWQRCCEIAPRGPSSCRRSGDAAGEAARGVSWVYVEDENERLLEDSVVDRVAGGRGDEETCRRDDEDVFGGRWR